MKRNGKIDILKGLSCIFVVFIHRPFPGAVGQIAMALGRAGVAFFFLTAGFYSYYEENTDINAKMKRKLSHMAYITVAALICYFVWEAFLRWFGSGFGSVEEWVTGYIMSADTWLSVLLWDVDPLPGHLWFLFALIRCYIIYWIIVKTGIGQKKYLLIPICCVMLFVMQYVFQNSQLQYYRNGWIYGMTFFMMGNFIACKRADIQKIPLLNKKICVLVGIFLTVAECLCIEKMQIYAGSVFLSAGALLLAVDTTCKTPHNMKFIEILGREYSDGVYIIHWSLREVFIKIDKMGIFASSVIYPWIVPLAILIVSVMMSWAIACGKKLLKEWRLL